MFQVKICGLTRRQDVELVAQAGADAIGLNFCPHSPRYVAAEQAADLVTAGPAQLVRVGVFVNASAQQIGHLTERLGLSMLQLHGDEPPELVADLPSVPLIRAFRYRAGDVSTLIAYLDRCQALGRPLAMVLLDAYVPGQPGGTGVTADWQALARQRHQLARCSLVLAGGLTPENVAQAVRHVRPQAVDSASGVESRPGIKDGQRVAAFVRQARQALAAIQAE